VELSRDLERLLRDQSGVVSRRQALAGGLTKSDVDRLLRRRVWSRMTSGVFVDHTGEPTWVQRAWTGVLIYEPAALAGRSAMRATAGPGWRQHDDAGPIEIAVAASRNVGSRPGYRVRFLSGWEDQVLTNARPPRVRFESAVLDVVAKTEAPLDRIQLLAGACQSRRTTASRLLQALEDRSRMSGRRWLTGVLRDIADGTCSVLEHGYLTRVERPHGLPRGRRQHAERDSSGRVYRDVHYVAFDQYVELDGRLFHDSAEARDADLERDLDAAVHSRGSVRLGWGQVYGRSCWTAAKIGRILVGRGWTGDVRACKPDCDAV
jgi:hypothetical protein